MKKFKFIIGFSALVLTSCQNDSQADSPVLGTWRATKNMIISGSNRMILLQNTLTDCEASTTYQFWSNGDFEYREYCSSPSIHETGTFSYGANSNTITFYITTDGNNQLGSETLYALTHTEMQIITSKSDYDMDGVQDTSVTVYTKQ